MGIVAVVGDWWLGVQKIASVPEGISEGGALSSWIATFEAGLGKPTTDAFEDVHAM